MVLPSFLPPLAGKREEKMRPIKDNGPCAENADGAISAPNLRLVPRHYEKQRE